MGLWIASILSEKILEILTAVTLIVVGLLVERYYIGRIAILSNAVALTTYFYKFNNLPNWLVFYINILTLFGIIAIISYATNTKLPKEYYWIAGIFSSAISGIILLWGLSL